MNADNRDPVRVLGRIKQKQWDKWKAAADLLGVSFTELAKNALDMHCRILRVKLREVDQLVRDKLAEAEPEPEPDEDPPKEPRRKLPKNVRKARVKQ
jgi:hypothetical protein